MSQLLLVEDSKVQALVATRMLKKAGHSVKHVTTGEQALNTCYENPPDIVLQDQHLEEMSGLEVCRRIKSDIALASIPVLVLTAGNRERDHIAALDAGADGFLPKDSPPNELLAVIARLVQTGRDTRRAGEHDEELAKRTRILAVDDSPTFLKMLGKRLTEVGFDVTCEASGATGISLLGQRPFDVAVVDVVMPEMDGFEFCRLARRWANENNMPLGVLMLTGSQRKDALVDALAAGADDYVPKQQDIDVILAHVTALARRIARAKQIDALTDLTSKQRATEAVKTMKENLRGPLGEIRQMAESLAETALNDGQRATLASIQQTTDSLLRRLDGPEREKTSAAESTVSGEQDMDAPTDIPDATICLKTAERRLPGGTQGIKELGSLLLDEMPKIMADIRGAIDGQDAKALQRGAHTLKGSADLFGGTYVVDTAFHIEKMGAENQFDSVDLWFDRLEVEVTKFTAALKKMLASLS